MRLLWTLALLLPPGAFCADHAILCLGDSITHGGSHRSYRYFLWQALVGEDLSFDFVGSMSSPAGELRPDYMGQAFDPHHEGVRSLKSMLDVLETLTTFTFCIVHCVSTMAGQQTRSMPN